MSSENALTWGQVAVLTPLCQRCTYFGGAEIASDKHGMYIPGFRCNCHETRHINQYLTCHDFDDRMKSIMGTPEETQKAVDPKLDVKKVKDLLDKMQDELDDIKKYTESAVDSIAGAQSSMADAQEELDSADSDIDDINSSVEGFETAYDDLSEELKKYLEDD